MTYISRKQLEALGEPIGEPRLGEKSRSNIGNHRYYGGGGKGDSEAPDYTALAAASEKAAELGSQLGHDQLDEAQRQYDLTKATSDPVVAAQLGLMNQTQAQGDDYFDYMKSYSRPVEQQLFYESMGFTPEEIQQIESSRSTEAAAFNAQQEANPTTTTIEGRAATPGFTPQSYSEWAAQNGYSSGGGGVQPVSGHNTMGGYAVDTWTSPSKGGINNAKSRADYQKYLDAHPAIAAKDGTPTQVTKNANVSKILSTPETDALTAKLGAAAAARLKAADQAERDKILGLNTDLATRIGESDVDVYNRNKANIDAESDQAVADARNGFTNTTNNVIRQGLRYGMSPAKIAAANAAQSTQQATVQAGAANATRKNATQTMYQRGIGQSGQLLTGEQSNRSNKIQDDSIATAKKLDVAGLYRGLPGASAGAYGLSLNAGNSAVNNTATPGMNLLNANQGAANTIMQGSQQQISGLTGIVGSQSSVYNANNSGDGGLGALGTVVGAGISAY